MKQAIFQVRLKFEYNGNANDAHRDALRKISDIGKKSEEKGAGFEELGGNAWLYRLDIGMPNLSEMIYLAVRANLPYRITYLENELKWDYFDPKNLLSDK